MSGKLYVVGTPIGNLGDLSERAKETLKNVDFIAAEDTRVTLKLLNRFEIKTPMISYHEHNKREKGDHIIERLQSGEIGALVTDAGMPAISDPGEDLVQLCHENGIDIESVPGPSALITALALSGMPSGRFCFEGFLSTARTARTEHLESLKNEPRTMILYEAPHKLISTLKDMLDAFGDRNIALVREITKIHEQVIRTSLSGAVEIYSEKSPKGEFVLIVEGKPEEALPEMTLEAAVSMAVSLMESGLSASSAAKQAATASGIKKGEIYRRICGNPNNNQ